MVWAEAPISGTSTNPPAASARRSSRGSGGDSGSTGPVRSWHPRGGHRVQFPGEEDLGRQAVPLRQRSLSGVLQDDSERPEADEAYGALARTSKTWYPQAGRSRYRPRAARSSPCGRRRRRPARSSRRQVRRRGRSTAGRRSTGSRGRVVDGDEAAPVARSGPGEGHEVVPRPVPVPRGPALEQLPVAVAEGGVLQATEEGVVEGGDPRGRAARPVRGPDAPGCGRASPRAGPGGRSEGRE